MGLSRQEYWCELPCLPPGELPDSGIKFASLMSPALAGSLPLVPPGKPRERKVAGPDLHLGKPGSKGFVMVQLSPDRF